MRINHFGVPESTPRRSRLALMRGRICLPPPPRGVNRDVHHPADLPVSVPSSFITRCQRCRNINRLPIGCASRLPLRPRLTLSRLPLPRNPETSGDAVSHRVSRYSCLHKRFASLQCSLSVHLPGDENAPLPIHIDYESRSFGDLLSPGTFSAQSNSTSELLRFL